MQKTIKLEEVVSENQDNEFSDSVSRDSYNNLQCQNENLQLLLSISKETCSDHELKLIDFKYQISNLEEQISNLKRENKQSADIIAVRNNIFNNLCDTIQNLESKNNYSDFYRQFPPPDFNSVNIGCPVTIVPFPPAQLQVNSRIPQDPRNRPSQQLINNPIDSQTSNDINGSSAFQINSNVFDWKNDSSAEGQIALMKLEWKMLEPSSSKADINLSPSLSLVEDGLEMTENKTLVAKSLVGPHSHSQTANTSKENTTAKKRNKHPSRARRAKNKAIRQHIQSNCSAADFEKFLEFSISKQRQGREFFDKHPI